MNSSYTNVVNFIQICTIMISIALSASLIQNSDGASSTGILIPLYVYPKDSNSWQPIIDTKTRHPNLTIIAIINPNNGPGQFLDKNYEEQINRLKELDIKMIGYVSTQWAFKPISEVKQEIDTWKHLYPQMEGIFFDEMSTLPQNVHYYSELGMYAKSTESFDFTVGNPGVDTISDYIGTVDNLVIHENSFLPSLPSLNDWHALYDKSNFSYLVHSKPTIDIQYIKSSSNHVSLLYVTDDQLDFLSSENDPWETISSHLGTIAQILDKPSMQVTIEARDFFGNLINITNNIEIIIDDIKVRKGSSPLVYNTANDILLKISANDYGNYTFAHWENFATNNSRTVQPIQNVTLMAFYENRNTTVTEPGQITKKKVIFDKTIQECLLLNGNMIIESKPCKVKTLTVNNSHNFFVVQFHAKVTPHEMQTAQVIGPDDIPIFPSFFSSCNWIDANQNVRTTQKWIEIIAQNGNALLTCFFRN